jgi:AsmA protein
MRILKRVGAVILGLVSLVFLGAVALWLWVDPNDFRPQIERYVEQKTQRSLRLAGELELKLFPWVALELNKVTLSNVPAYGVQPFLSAERIRLSMRLLPLLRRQVVVRGVAIDGLAVNLISRTKNDNNWQDLFKEQASDSSPSQSETGFSLAGIALRNANLSFKDLEESSSIKLSQLNVAMGAWSSVEQSFPLQAQFDLALDDAAPAWRIISDTVVNSKKNQRLLELKNLQVQARPMGQGSVLSMKADSLQIDTGKEILLPAKVLVGYGELPATLNVSGEDLFDAWKLAGSIHAQHSSLKEEFKKMQIQMPVTRDPKVFEQLALSSQFLLTEDTLQLDKFKLKLDDTNLAGQMAVQSFDANQFSFDLNMDQIDLDRYREPESISKAKTVSAPATELPADLLQELQVTGNIQIASLKVHKIAFGNVVVPVKVRNEILTAQPSCNVFGGKYQGNIGFDTTGKMPKLILNERFNNLDIGALLSTKSVSKRLVGRGNGQIKLTGQGKTDAALIKSLGGALGVQIKDGAINGTDLSYELQRAIALVKRESLPRRKNGAPRTEFKTLSANAKLANGVLSNDDIDIRSDYFRARGAGTLNIATSALNMRLLATAERARLRNIPIVITGTLQDMKVRPDVKAVLKEGVKEKIKDKLMDWLPR